MTPSTERKTCEVCGKELFDFVYGISKPTEPDHHWCHGHAQAPKCARCGGTGEGELLPNDIAGFEPCPDCQPQSPKCAVCGMKVLNEKTDLMDFGPFCPQHPVQPQAPDGEKEIIENFFEELYEVSPANVDPDAKVLLTKHDTLTKDGLMTRVSWLVNEIKLALASKHNTEKSELVKRLREGMSNFVLETANEDQRPSFYIGGMFDAFDRVADEESK